MLVLQRYDDTCDYELPSRPLAVSSKIVLQTSPRFARASRLKGNYQLNDTTKSLREGLFEEQFSKKPQGPEYQTDNVITYYRSTYLSEGLVGSISANQVLASRSIPA
jgi:hypothetical protein